MLMQRSRFVFFALFSLLLSGCASYQFGAGPRVLPGGYNKITVPMFTNHTGEPGVEPYFTSALIEELGRGHTAEVTDRSDAQVVLEGDISSILINQGPMCSSATCQATFKQLPGDAVIVTQYRIVVMTNLILRRVSDGTILWTGDFQGEQQYAAPQITNSLTNASDPLYNQSARHMTLKVIARAMMGEAYDRLTENF